MSIIILNNVHNFNACRIRGPLVMTVPPWGQADRAFNDFSLAAGVERLGGHEMQKAALTSVRAAGERPGQGACATR